MDHSNRKWLDQYKAKFYWKLDLDDWVQELDKAAAKPPIDSHLLYQDVSTQTDLLVLYTEVGVQTDPILTSDLTTKKALKRQKPNISLGAEGSQKREKRGSSHGIVVRKSPGPIGTRLPRREARAKSRVKTKAILQPQHVAHQAKPTHWRKPSGRVRVRKP